MSRNRHNNNSNDNNQVGLTCCYVKEKVNAPATTTTIMIIPNQIESVFNPNFILLIYY